ncbi:MAG: excinuclease ABC subunit C [Deltaproteobacteria bacterium RBG_16_47_11]|nr:MAG: excinuclease ABC subunit C [Deltaproteobacteria bacterium RBG_16_47_11]
MDMEQKIDRLPASPGVYLFKDEKGTILYVGKAGNIKHRVSSYFQKADGKEAKIHSLLEKVADISTIITDTEKEAFILENNLIKEHHPRYNVKLRDDKTYPLLKLSVEEEFPTLCIVRRAKKDGSLYFGPYPSATSLRETLKLIRRLFPIRTCLDTKFTHRLRPCINYEMGRCSAPCCGKADPAQYREIVHQVRMFLEGRDKDLVERLGKKMEEESEQLHFEAAAKIRDQIRHIEHVIEKQKIVSTDFVDQDVIGFYRQDHIIIVYPLFIRAGKLLGGEGFRLPSPGLPDEDILSSFLYQYYREGKFIPKNILISKAIPDQFLVEQWLTELKGEKVQVLVPERGNKKQLLKMACENAEKFLLAETEIEKDQGKLLEALRESLHLRRVPWRIEAFDISNIQGRYAVGSMVVFENGTAAKERYRHFKIKTIEGADDYGMMYEVLLRRYQKVLEQKDLPDLVLLDGGKGQLNVAQEVFKELQVKDVDLISLAKERTVEGRDSSRSRKTEEKIFHPRFKKPFGLGKHSALLHFLDRIRDEAHRFAITYHQKIRGKETVKSELGDIPGIGKTRERELLKFFGSVEKIKEATVKELMQTPKMNLKSSQRVYDYFRPHSS